MLTRCKFVCNTVTKRLSTAYDAQTKQTEQRPVYDFEFSVVYGGSEENKQFFASTPTGTIKVGTVREDAFELGKEYYVDFTPAT